MRCQKPAQHLWPWKTWVQKKPSVSHTRALPSAWPVARRPPEASRHMSVVGDLCPCVAQSYQMQPWQQYSTLRTVQLILCRGAEHAESYLPCPDALPGGSLPAAVQQAARGTVETVPRGAESKCQYRLIVLQAYKDRNQLGCYQDLASAQQCSPPPVISALPQKLSPPPAEGFRARVFPAV